MQRFPAQFADFADTGHLARACRQASLKSQRQRFAWLPGLIPPAIALAAVTLLDRRLGEFLRPMRRGIERDTITGMRENFTEVLPKTMSNRSVMLNDKYAPSGRAAARIGLLEMLASQSLRDFAAQVSGRKLTDNAGFQAICYHAGDYVGPHNDHHPEDENLRHGYVDVQITLSNAAVARQYLICEQAGYLNRVASVGVRSGVSVSYLPFWHQVTPLGARRGQESAARRWLLLASFEIAPPRPARKPRPR
jgi:hypothetical protein